MPMRSAHIGYRKVALLSIIILNSCSFVFFYIGPHLSLTVNILFQKGEMSCCTVIPDHSQTLYHVFDVLLFSVCSRCTYSIRKAASMQVSTLLCNIYIFFFLKDVFFLPMGKQSCDVSSSLMNLDPGRSRHIQIPRLHKYSLPVG